METSSEIHAGTCIGSEIHAGTCTFNESNHSCPCCRNRRYCRRCRYSSLVTKHWTRGLDVCDICALTPISPL